MGRGTSTEYIERFKDLRGFNILDPLGAQM